MDVHRENRFKAKSYSVEGYNIDKLTQSLQLLFSEKIFKLPGIRANLEKKIRRRKITING